MRNLKKHFFSYFKILIFIFLCIFSIVSGWVFKNIFFSSSKQSNFDYIKKRVDKANQKVISYFANNDNLKNKVENINKNYFPHLCINGLTYFFLKDIVFKDTNFETHLKEDSKKNYYFDFNGIWNFSELDDVLNKHKEILATFLPSLVSKLPDILKPLFTMKNIITIFDTLKTELPGDYLLEYQDTNNLWKNYQNLFFNHFIYKKFYENDDETIRVSDFFNFFPKELKLLNNKEKITINLNELLKTYFSIFFSYNFSLSDLKIDYNEIRINFFLGKRNLCLYEQ